MSPVLGKRGMRVEREKKRIICIIASKGGYRYWAKILAVLRIRIRDPVFFYHLDPTFLFW
jgi:hypothetical protein